MATIEVPDGWMFLYFWQRNASLEQELSELQARYTDAISARTAVEKQLLSTQAVLDELRSTHSQSMELIRDSEGRYVCSDKVLFSVTHWRFSCLSVLWQFLLGHTRGTSPAKHSAWKTFQIWPDLEEFQKISWLYRKLKYWWWWWLYVPQMFCVWSSITWFEYCWIANTINLWL